MKSGYKSITGYSDISHVDTRKLKDKINLIKTIIDNFITSKEINSVFVAGCG